MWKASRSDALRWLSMLGALGLLAATRTAAAADEPGKATYAGLVDDNADSLAPAGGSTTPTGKTRVANWSLLADAQLQSVKLSDLTTSFGIGVRYRSRRTDTALIIRKATDSTIAAPALSPDLGHLALNPASASVGASFQGEYFLNSGRRCLDPDCTDSYPGLQAGGYVSLDLGQGEVKATLPDASVKSTTVASASAVLGLVGRVADNLKLGDVERPIALGMYLGLAAHLIGGDTVAQTRKDLFGNDRSNYWGIEGGLFFQLASAEVTMRASQLWANGAAVQGLTGFQLVPRVTFSLPFDIVQYEPTKTKSTPPETSSTAPSATPAAAPAATTPAAAATTPAATPAPAPAPATNNPP